MRVRRVVDLSHPVDETTQSYPGDPQPSCAPVATIAGEGFNLLRVSMGSQSGTHVDAPYHFLETGRRVDEMDPELFTGPAVIADLTGKGARERITWVDLAPVAGALGPGRILVIRTGWDRHYGTNAYYDHPFVDAEAARRVLGTGVRTLAVDTINPDETVLDGPQPEGFPVHHLVAEAGGIIAENLTNLAAVDFAEPLLSLLPLRLTGADGAPVRAVALELGPQEVATATTPVATELDSSSLNAVTHSHSDSPGDSPSYPPSGSPSTTDGIADRYVDEYAALDPIAATFHGIAGHPGEITDYSPDGFEARAELDRRTLAALAAVVPRGEGDRAAVEAMRERLGTAVDRHEAGVPQTEINVVTSPLHSLCRVLDLMPAGGEQDWRAISARLAGMPQALAGYRRTLTEFAREGHAAARRQVLAVAEQCEAWTGRDDIFGKLVGKADVNSALRGELERAAAAAGASVADFGTFLREDLAPRARERDAVGRDRYAVASRYFLGAEVDLDEMYEWGLRELGHIEQEMTQVTKRVTGGDDIDEAVRVLDGDPKGRFETAEEFRVWMQELADRTIDDLHGTHFDIPEPVRRIECRIAPTRDGAIYYSRPSEDFSRPGRMWWSAPPDVTAFPTWRDVTTVYHEGVPGHHLQLGHAATRTGELNRWQRLLCTVSGNAEGWALYAERLMEQLGYLDEPGPRLGMLNAQRFRAARVVVDIGMHLQLPAPDGYRAGAGERWTPELGMAFLRDRSRMPEGFLRFELNRYLGWPGQAPSYKIGERIWLEAREDARRRKGPDFDLKGFHRAALDLGLLGLDPLRASLARI